MRWLLVIGALVAMGTIALAQIGNLTNAPINGTGVGQLPSGQPMYVPQGGTYVPPVGMFLGTGTSATDGLGTGTGASDVLGVQ